MKSKLFIVTLAAAVLAGGFTLSQTRAASPDGPASARGNIRQRVAEKLGLTDDQKTQIKTIIAGEKDTLKPLLSRLHEARTGLRDAIRASDASEASVRAAAAKVAAAEADLAVERLKLYGKIAPILTGDQRDKIEELEARMDGAVDDFIGRLGGGQAR